MWTRYIVVILMYLTLP